MNKSKLITRSIVSISPLVLGGWTTKEYRKNRQKKLQELVNESQPAPVEKDLSIEDKNIQFTILAYESVNLEHFQEIRMDEDEINGWKTFISTLGGETAKTAFTTAASNGLLKCDVPLKDLCRMKDNPELMRGWVMTDGKISKHASFSEVGIGNVAPLLVYQHLAAVTSQYYLQIIVERLIAIDVKLETIIQILKAEDRAKLKVAYKRFVELSKKNSYDIADKETVSKFLDVVDIIREKYRYLLSGIKNLDIDWKWIDLKEAEKKIQALKESRYFEYLDLAMQAEVLYFIASAVSLKIAKYLGNEEDAKIYLNRMSLNFWDNYVDQFNMIKHDVIKYLELEADTSMFFPKKISKKISKMKDSLLKEFNSKEQSMLKLQEQFEYRAVQYLKFEEDGTMKKYLEIRTE